MPTKKTEPKPAPKPAPKPVVVPKPAPIPEEKPAVVVPKKVNIEFDESELKGLRKVLEIASAGIPDLEVKLIVDKIKKSL